MKKSVYLTGITCTILMLLGCMFKIMHWPYASIMLVVGLGIFALIFLPYYGYMLLYNLSGNHSKIAGVFGSLLFISIALGALFKIQHWPGAAAVLVLEFVFLVFFIFPVLLVSKIKSSASGKEKLLHFFWFLSLLKM